ncbi:hypothetical protein LCGC14_1356510, partial [marine sediment metagenome]
MTPEQAMSVLVSAFRQQEIPQDTIDLYISKLRDINGPLLEATVNKLVETCPFFPTIAEIRLTAGGI